MDISSPIPLREIEDILGWVDGYKLSRPTKKLHRDFSDGVLLAEMLAVHYPKLVETHNYPPRNSTAQKINNWSTLNRKVLKRLKLGLCMRTVEQLANCTPGIIERVLIMVRDKIKRDEEEAKRNSLDDDQNQSSGGSYYEALGEDDNVLVVPVKRRVNGALEIVQQKVVAHDLYQSTKMELNEAKEAVETLKQKVDHIESLLKLKNEHIEELQLQLDKKVMKQRELTRGSSLDSHDTKQISQISSDQLSNDMKNFDERISTFTTENETPTLVPEQKASGVSVEALAARLNIIKARSNESNNIKAIDKSETSSNTSKSSRPSVTRIPLRTDSGRHSIHELLNSSGSKTPLDLRRSSSKVSQCGPMEEPFLNRSSEKNLKDPLKTELNGSFIGMQENYVKSEAQILRDTILESETLIRPEKIDASFVLIKSEIVPEKLHTGVIPKITETIDTTSAKSFSILGEDSAILLKSAKVYSEETLSDGKDDDEFKDTIDDDEVATILSAVNREATEIAFESGVDLTKTVNQKL